MALTFLPISESCARLLGIKANHSEAKETGEFRFRLLCSDDTAYIRTEAAREGAWQSSHYHEKVHETYIVQHGWMCFVELNKMNGVPNYKFYDPVDGPFTTQPGVIHNVYLPHNAVIHTVKHGDAVGEGRFETVETEAFDEKVTKLDEQALREIARALGRTFPQIPPICRKPHSAVGVPPPPTSANASAAASVGKPTYSDAYKHFDNLIWQMPVWSAAIFTLALTAIPAFKEDKIIAAMGLDVQPTEVYFFSVVGLFLLALYYALYRFRKHHEMSKDYIPDRVLSPQMCLQFMVLVLATSFGVLALRTASPKETWPFALGFILLGGLTLEVERRLRGGHSGGGKGGRSGTSSSTGAPRPPPASQPGGGGGGNSLS